MLSSKCIKPPKTFFTFINFEASHDLLCLSLLSCGFGILSPESAHTSFPPETGISQSRVTMNSLLYAGTVGVPHYLLTIPLLQTAA